MNNRFCVKKSSLTLFFTIAALFHISYVQLSSYYVPFQYTIIICSIAFLAIYVFLNIKSFAVADNIGINILILMFSLSMFWSSYSNSFRGTFDFRYVIINIAKYIFPFLVLQCIQNKEKTRLALKFLYGWALFYCVLSDLHAVLTKANTIGYIGTYIVGNKFNLCYLHFLLLALYFCVFHGKTSIKLTVEKRGVWRTLLHKLINIGVPYFAFSALYIMLNSLVGSGVNTVFKTSSILTLWYKPVAQYWFLYALILLFICYSVLSTIMSKTFSTIALFLVYLLSHYAGVSIGVFSSASNVALVFGLGFCAKTIDFSNVKRRYRLLFGVFCMACLMVIVNSKVDGYTSNLPDSWDMWKYCNCFSYYQ